MTPYEAILDRLLRVADLIFEDRDRLTRVEHELHELKKTKASSEDSKSLTFASITDFLKEIMPPQWWALALFLLLASMFGIISPKDVIKQITGKDAQEPREASSSHGE